MKPKQSAGLLLLLIGIVSLWHVSGIMQVVAASVSVLGGYFFMDGSEGDAK